MDWSEVNCRGLGILWAIMKRRKDKSSTHNKKQERTAKATRVLAPRAKRARATDHRAAVADAPGLPGPMGETYLGQVARGAVPPEPPQARGRTRTEIRQSCATVFDTLIRSILEKSLHGVLADLAQPNARLDVKTHQAVLSTGQLYAQLGIGFIGVNQVDPAEVPNLPAPIIQTFDPNAPLPDGA